MKPYAYILLLSLLVTSCTFGLDERQLPTQIHPSPVPSLTQLETSEPESTSMPTFEEELGIVELSSAGEHIKELVMIFQDLGVPINIDSLACAEMQEPYISLNVGEHCRALSRFSSEDYIEYPTTVLFMIFQGDVSLDSLHNPRVLHTGVIGDEFTYIIADVADLKYINEDEFFYEDEEGHIRSRWGQDVSLNFVLTHEENSFSEGELNESFTDPGRTKLAEDLAYNLYLGCSLVGTEQEIAIYEEIKEAESSNSSYIDYTLTNYEMVDAHYQMLKNGETELVCNPASTPLANLVGAFGIREAIANAVSGRSSTVVVPSPSPTRLTEIQELPFPDEQGNETWEYFNRFRDHLSRNTGMELKPEIKICQTGDPLEELVVYEGANGCWRIADVETIGAEDSNPENTTMDYFGVLSVRLTQWAREDGSLAACTEVLEKPEHASLSRCWGPYATLDVLLPDTGWIAETSIGFTDEAVKEFSHYDTKDSNGRPYADRGELPAGLIGVDKETYLFLIRAMDLNSFSYDYFDIGAKVVEE